MEAARYVSLGFVILTVVVQAQEFDIVLYGGRVFDPLNGIIGQELDIGIFDGKIAAIAPFIQPDFAERSVNVSGLIVAPGLIDVHSHVYHTGSTRTTDARADMFCPRSGVTTVVDAGGVGADTFQHFRETVAERERTRVMVWLSVWSGGNSNTTVLDVLKTAETIEDNPDLIVGVKIFSNGFSDYTLLDAGLLATEYAGGKPIILDWKYLPEPLEMEDILLNKFRPGDVLTHAYGENPDSGANSLVDPATGVLRSYVRQAQDRGILFDAADGNVDANFAFRQSIPAVQQNFIVDTISTDLTLGQYFSVDGSVVDQCTIMSKCMASGMTFQQVLEASTVNAAQMINRPDLGHLSVGAGADVSVLSLTGGTFGFRDGYGDYHAGSATVEAHITLRDGVVVWDRNSLFNRDNPNKKTWSYLKS